MEYSILIDTVHLQELTLVEHLLATVQFWKVQQMPILI
jgi:hypothetical protein